MYLLRFIEVFLYLCNIYSINPNRYYGSQKTEIHFRYYQKSCPGPARDLSLISSSNSGARSASVRILQALLATKFFTSEGEGFEPSHKFPDGNFVRARLAT